jgi:hypothetical protein
MAARHIQERREIIRFAIFIRVVTNLDPSSTEGLRAIEVHLFPRNNFQRHAGGEEIGYFYLGMRVRIPPWRHVPWRRPEKSRRVAGSVPPQGRACVGVMQTRSRMFPGMAAVVKMSVTSDRAPRESAEVAGFNARRQKCRSSAQLARAATASPVPCRFLFAGDGHGFVRSPAPSLTIRGEDRCYFDC